MKIQVYPDRNGKWRWRRKSSNGQNCGASGEAYYSKSNAVRAARTLAKRINCKVTIEQPAQPHKR